jgi:dipeptidyl aminopeptidase/acylaminoacyl peptidase
MVKRQDVVVDGAGVELEAIVLCGDRPSAAVVLLHGWGGSARTMVPPAVELAELGYLAVSVSMRGWGRSGGVDDCGLHQGDDVVAVVRWVASTYPRCATRIGLLGISQGGQVALLCAARCRALAAVAAWAPVTDVAAWRATTTEPGIPGYIDATCRYGNLTSRSPLSRAADLALPVLLVHGSADTRVPTEQSRLLHDAVNAAGGHARLEILDGIGHGRGPSGNRRALDLTIAFFATHLAGPR